MEKLSAREGQSWLSWFSRGLLILGMLLLFGRVFELQVIKGAYFKRLAEGNRIRRVTISAPRGKILARGGEVLVGNKEVRRKIVFSPETGYEKVDESTGPNDEITEWVRDYPIGDRFAHVGGYIGEVSEFEIGKIDPQCAERGPKKIKSYVGKTGLEAMYDCVLSGIDGEELIEVDTRGVKIRTLGRKDAIPGEDIRTTMDYSLQNKVAEIMKEGDMGVEYMGSVVVTDAQGEVLALYSSPSFNPNEFVNGNSSGSVEKLLESTKLPLFNRAIGGLYHPGSIYKPIIAIAGLEEGKIDNNYTFEDTGVITVNDFSYTNWYFTQYGGKEGSLGVQRALARSTDTFFYKLGEMVGVEKIAQWSQKFGLDNKTGIDLPGEAVGLIPTPEWKLKTKGERWFLGNTYHMAIGQGDVAITPIAINRAISTIANNGNFCQPHIISKKNNCQNLGAKKENINLVKRGMLDACTSGGTGFPFFNFELPKFPSERQVGCKTGTAETGENENTHAWFTSFAPFENPEIITTVLVENGGEGSSVAGPVARKIFNYWFGVEDIMPPTPTPYPN